MTTMELCQRLSRHMSTPDISTMASDEAMALLDAANAGLQKVYATIPQVYRRTSVSTVLRAPRTVTIGVQKYSNELTSGIFDAGDRGCTVRIPGDLADNEITAPTEMLGACLAPTGVVQATVYSDAVGITEEIDRIVSAPRLDTGDVLTRRDAVNPWRECERLRRETGRPREYFLAPVGVSLDGVPMALLRLYPLPDRDYRMDLELELHPKRLTFPDMSRPVHLPVQPAIMESVVIPLCEWELAATRYFTGSKAAIEARRADALIYADRVTHHLMPPQTYVGTPRGF